MNSKNIFRQCICAGFKAILFLGSILVVHATINVTDYGAKGDLLTLDNVSVVNNSSTLVCSNASFVIGDVGKLIEVWNAGIFQTVSNQTLVAVITNVVDASTVQVSIAPSRTATGLSGCYGTDNRPGFSNAIAAASYPTDTIIIPSGNYLLIASNVDENWLDAVEIRRGGLTFTGQGTAILTGQGGWRDSTITTAQGPAPKGRRGALFYVLAPCTNINYPLVWTNLTFFGGIDGWNGGGNNGPSLTDGTGWDNSHHAFGYWTITGSVAFPLTNNIFNCTFHGWRGETIISGLALQGGFFTVSNCVFYDGNATVFNMNMAHDWNSCTISTYNEVEEFYRSYATNASYLRNCVITNMHGSGQISLNGGQYGNPTYTICNNRYIATNLNGAFLGTTPATEVMVISNYISGGGGGGIINLGTAGYQDEYNICNSNIYILNNTFTNCYRGLAIKGAGQNKVVNVLVASNTWQNCGYIGTGYGWSTNVVFYRNTVTGLAGIFEPTATLQGQYFIDASNNYTPYLYSGGAMDSTNLVTAKYGSKVAMDTYRKIMTLDASNPGQVPPGATMTFSNAGSVWSGNPDGTFTVYSSTHVTGTPIATLATGQSQTFYWNKIKGGYAWMTYPIVPPSNLHTNSSF